MAFSIPFPLLLLLLLFSPLLPPVFSQSPSSHHFWWNELPVMGGGRRREGEKGVDALTNAKEGLDRQGFRAYGKKPHLFVRYSAYRYSPTKFFVVGQTAHSYLDTYPENQIFSECLWISEPDKRNTSDSDKIRNPDPSVVGTVKTIRSLSRETHEYELVIVECEFAQKIGGSSEGLLSLQPAPSPPTRTATVSSSMNFRCILCSFSTRKNTTAMFLKPRNHRTNMNMRTAALRYTANFCRSR